MERAAIMGEIHIDKHVHYRKYRWGEFKYITTRDHYYQTNILGCKIDTPYIKLFENGILWIKKGYIWDGASGPTIDTKSSMRGSLIHDTLYQLMRRSHLNFEFRGAVDMELYYACIEDRMWKWRAEKWLKMVKAYASSAAKPKMKGKVLIAP